MHVLHTNMQLESHHWSYNMVSVSAERNSHRLKLTHPKLFTDICYSHAGQLLGITDRCRLVGLLGDIQGPVVDPLASRASVATTKKLFKGINFCLCLILHMSLKCTLSDIAVLVIVHFSSVLKYVAVPLRA